MSITDIVKQVEQNEALTQQVIDIITNAKGDFPAIETALKDLGINATTKDIEEILALVAGKTVADTEELELDANELDAVAGGGTGLSEDSLCDDAYNFYEKRYRQRCSSNFGCYYQEVCDEVDNKLKIVAG